ncbi:tyrosine-type recombinase/integrase [Bacteroides cellulosilyticus]|uniref:tyrosine-type recombinase/integrase n=1 Tax=Bacteroides cellulosilyticus TaxID=246787 RepID=UPI001D084CD8|nr:phage integrase SAM-like domain-containing protein [Bacteroides cellulosilyticus]MCB6594504.1 site-specific integrase [Bacteroides cellulosilyticus]
MATFKTMVRYKRTDGFYQVYIRVVHRTKSGYIKTDKFVTEKQLSKSGEIKDPVVNEYCSREILHYMDMINRHDVSQYTITELINFLLKSEEEVCFSDYATQFISRMINEGHERNAKNYRLAVNHLERYLGTNKIMFPILTSAVLSKWIDSLGQTNRAKEMYPTCIRQIFKKAIKEFNDEERGRIRIKFNPWLKIAIPKSDRGAQKAISAEACREFFNRPLPVSKMISPLPELGRDMALLSLCLGGINSVDLYELKKKDYKNGIIGYKRAKTRNSRSDDAYMEMRVEPFILSTFEKYLSKDSKDEYLFNFHQRYSNSDSFNANINIGIRKICEDMGMAKEDKYCYYTFRHTWATIAQNDCDANLYEVAFGMNHSHGFNVTRGYVKIDFTPAWELNAKVIDFIFFSDQKSKQGKARDWDEPKDVLFRITKKKMIYGRAYFKGKVVAEMTDIGFSNVDEVIARLVKQLPKDIPTGCNVQFRLTNCDTQREAVYERSKGKGF